MFLILCLEIVNLADVFWSDHATTHELNTRIEEIDTDSNKSLKRVADDIMAQLDSFDTALTRHSLDQDAELARLATSHENLRRLVCDNMGEATTTSDNLTTTEMTAMTTSAMELTNRLLIESMLEPIRGDLDDIKSEQISITKALQFMRDNVRSATSIKGGGIGLDKEAVERIQDTLVDMDAKMRSFKQLIEDLFDSDRAKHNTLDDLQGVMMNIQSSIVTKDLLDDIIKTKVVLIT